MKAHKFFAFGRLSLVLISLLSALNSYADHLKGGWIKYEYLGVSGSNVNYRVSFYQYSDCSEPEKVDPSIYLAIFGASYSKVLNIGQTSLKTELKSNFGPCFQNPPTICYLVAEYTTTISLPKNLSGYTLAVQRCCRIAGIANVPNSNAIGLTYTVTIPGGLNSNNSSPVFDFRDTVAICFNAPFTLDLGAKDIDGDSLTYALCDGLTGGSQIEPVVMDPAAPPYSTIPYIPPYSGTAPLGSNVTVDPKTGLLSGTAPAQIGTYVVAVCVNEYRNGVFIANTRKEIHLDVENCQLGGAALKPVYITCNGFDFRFSNENPDKPDYKYLWDFGVNTINTDTSTQSHPTYTYKDTGDYIIKLTVSNSVGCTDSATAHLKIYPGFVTDFSINGSCIFNPYNFTDLTKTDYGYVDSWRWNFGESPASTDSTQNPLYTYPTTGTKTITLITTNSKGCIDTATKVLTVTTGPDLSMKFVDTLICSIDTLRLESFSNTAGAVFSWAPQYNLIGSNSDRPFVYPKQTTTYDLTVSYNGCVAKDSVLVNVIDQVLLNLPNDTTICGTDSIPIIPNTNALYFTWSPSAGLSDPKAKAPLASPLANTTYSVVGSVGKCTANDAMNVRVVPYPLAQAGFDALVCYGKTVQLRANIKGADFKWFPTNSLLNSNTLDPVAGPQSTTSYILSVTDTLGCPKPVTDTVIVTVIPKVQAFAGNDTAIVVNQPLQLNATGGSEYVWAPTTYLSNPLIFNPVAMLPAGKDSMSYRVKVGTPEGCNGYDSLNIYVFETLPEIFVPNAFTPNHDGINDVFRPKLAGMKRFYYFRVYNRWGELLYSTGDIGKGWDGTFNGRDQASGTYVWAAQATDYKDHTVTEKGTFVLIR